ncbi:MAG: AMP-binding protein, partial [Bacteroidota bacterium]
KVLAICADITDLEVIITAGAFYDKIKEQIPEDISHRLLFLDKEVKNISLGMKLKGLLMSKIPALINTKIDETAVVLFTSGSETVPKAVPLTHENVVSNLAFALKNFDIRANGVFLSFLPPFHSFGFTVLSILPLITGVKAAYTPNPTNIREVVDVLKHTKANNIIVTPTLLKMIMERASEEDMSTVELVISGAESLHKDTFEHFMKLTGNQSIIVEGYGITECSPIVSLTPKDKPKLNSVGKIIEGLDCHIIDIDTDEPVSQGKEGMIVVAGNSIFSGYMDDDIDDPFMVLKGDKYYRTGDLGYFDEEGYLFITGRLKRFVKIGGEMVSMPYLERILLEKYGEDGRQVLAVEGSDKTNDPIVALFTIKEIDLSEVNRYLRDTGVASIARIRDIRIVDEIPLLGSGKTNYRALKAMIEEDVIEN